MILTPKNWSSFQHYKDRAPAWIKLHRGLLDNLDYYRLSPEAAKALPLIWLIASERDGQVPAGAELAFRLRIDEELANDILVELMASNFLVASGDAETVEQTATLAQRTAKSNGFGKRHISDVVKRAVWSRDGGKCCACGSDQNVEYDHKVPVSKGGNSEEENIQLLCRPCNRAKRTKLATPAQPLRSPEKRREEEEKEYCPVGKPTRTKAANAYSEEFETGFWQPYPRTPNMSKLEAWQVWVKLSEDDRRKACEAIEPYKRFLRTKPDLETVHACRFLSKRRFDGFSLSAVQPTSQDIRSSLV